MPVSEDFLLHALDLVSLAGKVSARRMFGGIGLYEGGVMFGLLDDDDIYLKTDEESRPTFAAAGCTSWIYPGHKGPQETSYFRPPDAAHDSAEEMLPWAKLAIAAARRKQAKKAPAKKAPPKKTAPAARKKARPR